MSRLRGLLILLALISVPNAVYAGGFEVPENVTRAAGRGGSYTAVVDEPSAIYFNPAGLTRVKGFGVTANLHLWDYNARYERAPFQFFENGIERDRFLRTKEFAPVENSVALSPAPMLFMSHDFGLEDWTFGFALYGPSSVALREYPDYEGEQPTSTESSTFDGGQAYMLIEETLFLVYPSISAAHLFEQANLSVGLTLQLAYVRVDQTLGVDGDGNDIPADGETGPGHQPYSSNTVDNFVPSENPALYTPNRLSTDGLGFTGIVGLMWDPIARLSVGASYRPRFKLESSGTIAAEFGPQLEGFDLSIPNDRAELELWMPDVVRAGLVYRHRDGRDETDAFNVSADFVWEGWSVLDAFRLTFPGAVRIGQFDQSRELPELVLPKEYDDVYSVRLGAELNQLRHRFDGDGIVFRLGAFYESAASPEEFTHVDFTPFDRFSGSAGASYHFGAWSLDAGYSYIWSPERTVDEGEYDLITPLWVCEDPTLTGQTADGRNIREACANAPDPAHSVNNGTYEVSYQLFSLGLTYGW